MMEKLQNAEARLSPSQVIAALTDGPTLTTGEGRWDRAVLQRYKHPPSWTNLSSVRDHIIVLNLGPPFLMEDPQPDGRVLRTWYYPDQISVTPAGASVHRHSGLRDVGLLHIRSELVEEVETAIYGHAVDRGDLPAQLAVPGLQMGHLAHLLVSEAENLDTPGSTLISNLLVKSVIIQILRSFKYNEITSETHNPSLNDPRITRVLLFMRENFAEKISADELAVISGASKSSFSRLFRECVGQSAYQHLTALRLEHALKLLEKTSLAITEIAFESGFGQSTHFTTVFRERFGVSPRAWRNANSLIAAPTFEKL